MGWALSGVDSPGPANYAIVSSLGDVGLNNQLYSNTNGFGSAERMGNGVAKGNVLRVTPGPGDYLTGYCPYNKHLQQLFTAIDPQIDGHGKYRGEKKGLRTGISLSYQ